MRLHPLLAALDRDRTFRELVEALQTPGAGTRILSVITPARAYALAALHAALEQVPGLGGDREHGCEGEQRLAQPHCEHPAAANQARRGNPAVKPLHGLAGAD